MVAKFTCKMLGSTRGVPISVFDMAALMPIWRNFIKDWNCLGFIAGRPKANLAHFHRRLQLFKDYHLKPEQACVPANVYSVGVVGLGYYI